MYKLDVLKFIFLNVLREIRGLFFLSVYFSIFEFFKGIINFFIGWLFLYLINLIKKFLFDVCYFLGCLEKKKKLLF